MAKERLSFEDYRPLRKGEAGFSETKRQHISPSTGEIIPTARFQKLAGSQAPSRLTKTEREQKAGIPPTPKPTPIKPPKGARGYGQHVKHQRNEQGEIVRTRVNARATDTFQKQFDRVPQGSGIILHFVNSRTGQTIKAVNHGKNHTASIDDIRKRVNDRVAKGESWDSAFWGEVSDSFDLYDEGGNAIDFVPADFTNIIMYSEAA